MVVAVMWLLEVKSNELLMFFLCTLRSYVKMLALSDVFFCLVQAGTCLTNDY